MQDCPRTIPRCPGAEAFPELILPPALSEIEVLDELRTLAGENNHFQEVASFLGAGAYNHFVPSVVDFLLQRSEFFTAYTPYQPEISQGTLQAHFEYQTMIVALTGMEVANVSHYDGGTAAAEAVIMALQIRHGGRNRVVLGPTVHPQYREVVHTYTQGMGLSFAGEELPLFDLEALAQACDSATACVLVQNPDFLGRLYTQAEMQALADAVHACGAVFVVSVDPISLGLFVPPGQYGADIVIGEGQALGNSISFGGPYLGFFAMKLKDVRKSAGRIVGRTVDSEGKPGFVLTLSTREQHIRREKASSNICSNEALNALAYGHLHGGHGQAWAAHGRRALLSPGALRRRSRWAAAWLSCSDQRAILQGIRPAVPAARLRDQRPFARRLWHCRRLRSGPGLSRVCQPHAALRDGVEQQGRDRRASRRFARSC